MLDILLIFSFSFIIVYGFYYITIIRRPKKLEKFKSSNQIIYFKKLYQLDFRKISFRNFAKTVSLTNSFIISLTVILVDKVKNLGIKLLIAFVFLFPIILLTYHIIGKIYQRRMKNES